MSDEQKTNGSTAVARPQGRKLIANLSAARLNPGVGKRVQRSGKAELCGRLWGFAYAYLEHPNNKDPAKVSRRFAGSFRFQRADGSLGGAAECYLPGTLERGVKAALDKGAQRVPLSAELWCEPDEDETRPSVLGYSYGTYERITADAEIDELAYQSGILPRPAPARTMIGRDLPDDIDPETGEEIPPAGEGEAAEGAEAAPMASEGGSSSRRRSAAQQPA